MSASRSTWLGDEAGARRRAVASGLAGALTALLCLAVFAEPFDVPVLDATTFVFVGTVFVLIALPVRLGGRRGLAVTWAILAALWLFALYTTAADQPWLIQAVRMLPGPFIGWSWLALPVAVATVMLVGGSVSEALRRHDLPLLSVWIGLMIASARLAEIALDVGGTPRLYPSITITVGVVLTPAPLFLVWWGVRSLRRRAPADEVVG